MFIGSVSLHASPISNIRLLLLSPSILPLKFLSSPYPSLASSPSVSRLLGSVSVQFSLCPIMPSGQSRPDHGSKLVGKVAPSPSTQPLRFKSSTPSGMPSLSLSGFVGSVTVPADRRVRSPPKLMLSIPGTLP